MASCYTKVHAGPGSKSRSSAEVVILDGDKAYEVDGNGKAASVWADGWRKGLFHRDQNVDRLGFCPLPGVSLPGVDLIQSPRLLRSDPGGQARFSGHVPRLNLLTGGELPYRPGEAAVVMTQAAAAVPFPDGPLTPRRNKRIAFMASGCLKGHWIGSQMRMISYEDAVDNALTRMRQRRRRLLNC